MNPTSSGRAAAAYGPGRGTLHTTSTTARQAHVGLLGPAGQAAGR